MRYHAVKRPRIASTSTSSGISFAAAADLSAPLTLSGSLSIRDLVDALVALAGFEAGGATETLASLLGFDASNPPEKVPFRASLTLTPEDL